MHHYLEAGALLLRLPSLLLNHHYYQESSFPLRNSYYFTTFCYHPIKSDMQNSPILEFWSQESQCLSGRPVWKPWELQEVV